VLLLVVAGYIAVLESIAAGDAPAAPGASDTGFVGANSIPPGCNPTQGAGFPDRTALQIPDQDPSINVGAGDHVNVTFEFNATAATVPLSGLNVYTPTIFVTMPKTDGTNFPVTFSSHNFTFSSSPWTSLSVDKLVTGNFTFNGSATGTLSTQKIGTMADTPYGTLMMQWRWSWNVSSPNGSYDQGPWSVPTSTIKTGFWLPSIFKPAPYVDLVSESSPNETIGSTYVENLTGDLAGRSFYFEMETPIGVVVDTKWVTDGMRTNATYSAKFPLIGTDGSLLPGKYLVHIHDSCGAMLYSKSVVLSYSPSATIEIFTNPADCGAVMINGMSYTDGQDATIAPSATAYELNYQACVGSAFSSVARTGGVYFPSPGLVVISWNGSLTASFVPSFQQPYNVTISEAGLPNGTTWYSNVTNGPSYNSTGDIIEFTETNGSYSFSVASVNESYVATYAPVFVVNGAAVNVSVTFSLTYGVSFRESGLPAGLSWAVTFHLFLRNLTTDGGTDTIVFAAETNGSYSYSIGGLSGWQQSTMPYAGRETIRGAALAENVTYAQVTYGVTFSESGLSAGLGWSVTFNGTSEQITTDGGTDNLTFAPAPNGTYAYSIVPVAGWYVSGIAYSGDLPVDGAPLLAVVLFVPVLNLVIFTEVGLPSGTTWYVNGSAWGSLSETVMDALGTSTKVNLTNGTYNYDAASGNKTWAPNATSPFRVDGNLTMVAVNFSEVNYSVSLTEDGLPSGTPWNVTIGGATVGSDGSTLFFLEPNGTYDSTAATSDKEYAPMPAGNTFEVSGSSVSETVTFILVTYNVTFTETGLPGGTEWWVNVSGQPSGSSSTSAITLNLPNGTYVYSMGTADKTYGSRGGGFDVDGTPVDESVTFGSEIFTVTYTESGLPTGTEWWANVTGQAPVNSSFATMAVSLLNGTYDFSVATANKEYEASTPGGSFVVNGASVAESVTFRLVTYSVSFEETGLPVGTEWWVNLSAPDDNMSITSELTWHLTNGTYLYSIGTSDSSYLSPAGEFTVNGKAIVESITFGLVTYSITFTEAGLLKGAEWWLNLTGGQDFTSTASTLTFYEANGTYAYTTSAIGYPSLYGKLTVRGPAAGPETVIFYSLGPPAEHSPSILLYEVLAAMAIVVVVGVVGIAVSRRGKSPPPPDVPAAAR
jgi:hypothetical protein